MASFFLSIGVFIAVVAVLLLTQLGTMKRRKSREHQIEQVTSNIITLNRRADRGRDSRVNDAVDAR